MPSSVLYDSATVIHLGECALSEWTLEKALRLALKREEASIRLYTAAQDKVLNRSSIELLKEFIIEEEKHKSKMDTRLMPDCW